MEGVSRLISTLRTFTGTPFFLLDEMHLIGGGIAKQFYRMINPSTKHSYMGTTGQLFYSFRLSNEFSTATCMAKIREHVVLCADKVPRLFEGSLKAAYGHYRAVDWQLFLLAVIPNIVLPFFVEDGAKNALMNLVNGCNLALNRELKESQIIRMDM